MTWPPRIHLTGRSFAIYTGCILGSWTLCKLFRKWFWKYVIYFTWLLVHVHPLRRDQHLQSCGSHWCQCCDIFCDSQYGSQICLLWIRQDASILLQHYYFCWVCLYYNSGQSTWLRSKIELSLWPWWYKSILKTGTVSNSSWHADVQFWNRVT